MDGECIVGLVSLRDRGRMTFGFGSPVMNECLSLTLVEAWVIAFF